MGLYHALACDCSFYGMAMTNSILIRVSALTKEQLDLLIIQKIKEEKTWKVSYGEIIELLIMEHYASLSPVNGVNKNI